MYNNNNHYREAILKNSPHLLRESKKDNLSLTGLGLTEEAGEVAGVIKKHLYHGKPLDRDKLVKELGDVRWYMEVLMYTIGTDMEEVERVNVAKVIKRYPDGFNHNDANNRKYESPGEF